MGGGGGGVNPVEPQTDRIRSPSTQDSGIYSFCGGTAIPGDGLCMHES